jgi:hypothetical protein
VTRALPIGRRRLHLGAVAGTAAHHGFELAAGVGLVFQPYAGLGGALAGWGAALPAWAALAASPRLARRVGPAGDAGLALLAGVSLAGALLHFALWPVERRPSGHPLALPVLVEAEGLGPRQLPAYNAILYCWAAASLAALAAGTPSGSRRWAVLGLASWIPLAASARHHFAWLRAEAISRPAWWNRAGRVQES